MNIIRMGNPELVWFLWLIPFVMFLLIFANHRKKTDRLKYADKSMLKALVPGLSEGKLWLKSLLMLLAFSMLLLALIDPQIGTKLEEVKREGVDIMMVVDVSASMTAEDIKPSRLKKAKHSISSFIDKLRGDRIGIVAFAGDAFTQCPLTLDYGAAEMFTEVLDTSLIPVQGTALAKALETAANAFSTDSPSQKVMVIITDGEDHEKNIEKAIDIAKERGIIIYTVGMGSPSGAPVPSARGYLQDKKGSVVLSKLNESLLMEIALHTGGGYFRATPGEDELEKIYLRIFKMEKTELASKQYTNYEDRFQLFAGAALLLLILEMFVSETRGAWARFFKVD